MANELTHFYGPQVHVLSDIFHLSLLADLCHPKTQQPQINSYVQILYTQLMNTCLSNEFPQEIVSSQTRMIQSHPEAVLTSSRIKKNQKTVVVNLARAGTYPSHICYEHLHWALEPSVIRQDHIFASRKVNAKEEVTGTDLSAAKIGGDVAGSVVLFPDPMGATGSTLNSAIDYYKNLAGESPFKLIALHLIVTPEYLKNVLSRHPDLIIYCYRVDRGLSPKEVLDLPPGQKWDLEKGLNQMDYIVPGGGGFGEIMNNSFV